MKKRVISFFLVLALIMSISTPVMLAESVDYTPRAEVLKSLGLFLGSDSGFELERVATRLEAAVMVVRLLGKEEVARAENKSHPFNDVPEWANYYVGYLYQNNITKGVSADSFGSADTSTAAQYATYVLRALGYDDSKGDFYWDQSLEKMAEKGIISSGEAASFASSAGILRGEVVAISYASLFAFPQNESTTLLEKLYLNDGVISSNQLAAALVDDRVAMVANVMGVPSPPSSKIMTAEEIFALASPATFRIDLKAFDDQDAGSGSGFFISADGIAVTNFHVLAYANSASVLMSDGKSYPIEGILGVNPEEDLALIKIKGADFPFLTLGDAANLRSAQRIYCMGSPYGLDNSISDGLVSNPNRNIDGINYIQISAPIAPGSSGGALLNEYGQVVGVTTASSGDTNINLAVPTTQIRTISKFNEVRSLRYLQAHARIGVAPYGLDQTESGQNDQRAIQGLKNGDVLAGTISSASDVDYYYVETEDISALLVSLTSDTAHSMNLKFDVLDANLEKVLFSSQHYSNEVFSCAIGSTPTPGRYIIKIYVDGGNQVWNELKYDLFCYWLATEDDDENYPMVISEFEPNDTPPMANFIPLYGMIIGTLESASDVDYYSFNIYKKGYYGIVVGEIFEENGITLSCEIINAKDNSVVDKLTYESEYELYGFADDLEVGQYYLRVTAQNGNKPSNHLYMVTILTND